MTDWFTVETIDKEWLSVRFPIPLQVVKRNLMCEPCDFPKDFILDDYQIFKGTPQHILHDGDCLDLGNRKLKVIHTPGHSPGHCCFYEPDRKCPVTTAKCPDTTPVLPFCWYLPIK